MNSGVFAAELPLSESPVLGDWTITAEVGEEVITYVVSMQIYAHLIRTLVRTDEK